MTIEELFKKCKCGVYLTVNEHRDSYQKVEDKIIELNGQEAPPDIDEELKKRMIETDTIYELHFYPRTPVGFYEVFGTSLEEVLEKAEECLNQE